LRPRRERSFSFAGETILTDKEGALIKHLRLISGIVLLVCGLLGLILPIIPGIPLLIAGAALLGFDHPLIRPFARRFAQWRNRRSSSIDKPKPDVRQ
jgi:hypothetical protein